MRPALAREAVPAALHGRWSSRVVAGRRPCVPEGPGPRLVGERPRPLLAEQAGSKPSPSPGSGPGLPGRLPRQAGSHGGPAAVTFRPRAGPGASWCRHARPDQAGTRVVKPHNRCTASVRCRSHRHDELNRDTGPGPHRIAPAMSQPPSAHRRTGRHPRAVLRARRRQGTGTNPGAWTESWAGPRG